MATDERTTGAVAILTATLLSGWKVPTLQRAKALVAAVLTRTPYKEPGK